MLSKTSSIMFKALTFLLVASVLVGCGGSPSAPEPSEGTTPPAGSQPTTVPAGAGEPTPTAEAPSAPAAPPSEDLQTRISDSYNLTLGTEEAGLVLGSFHIEIAATEPSWDADSSQVVTKNWTLSADMSGDDVHLIYTGDGETSEGWGIDQGQDNEKWYEMVEGQAQESFLLPLVWLNTLTVSFPLIIGATGPTPQGADSVDGRAAEKYALDSANAPAGVMGAVGLFLNITAARGTVWLDQQTGALLKASLDYDQKFVDPEDQERVVGSGSGHVEIMVTQVGQVDVQLP